MKNIISDNSAVSYLLLVSVLTIIFVGIAYNFMSDMVDAVLNNLNNYQGTPLENQMDSDSVNGGNFLLMSFKFFLIPALLVIIYWAWNMSQKPERKW